MKSLVLSFALLMAYPLAGFQCGIGFSWNTIDETFSSNLHTNEDKSGKDRYEASQNRLAPAVLLSHEFPFCDEGFIGLLAEWKYLNYKTPNVSSSRGQILPNATFSSINIFGPEVIRDFTSKTHLDNEIMLLAYFGKVIMNGSLYLGLGPVFFTALNRVYVSSVHIPNAVGDHLISTSVKRHKVISGGAVQLGYQYCLEPFSLIINYTYLQSAKYDFNNTVNAGILNGADTPGRITLFLKRNIKFSSQGFQLLMNFVF